MKPFQFVYYASLLPLTISTSSADILYVNNDTAFPAEYRSFDDAFAAAVDGDTIMLAPSLTTYGDIVVIGKSIKVIGGGTSNKFATLQPKNAEGLDTIVDQVFIGLGEQDMTPNQPVPDFSGANGTQISSVRTRMGVWIWSDDCVFSRCETASTFSVSGDRNIITGCELAGIRVRSHLNPVLNSTGTQFLNCVIPGGSDVNNDTTASFSHCIIGFNLTTGTPGGSGTYSTLASTTFRHCIIAGSTNSFNSYRSEGTRLHNCLVVGTVNSAVIPPHSSENNNLITTDQDSVFDEGFVLKAGSPAIGAGEDGEDLGVFGGPTPFEWGGFPALPLIEQFDILSANPATGLRFRVKAVARD